MLAAGACRHPNVQLCLSKWNRKLRQQLKMMTHNIWHTQDQEPGSQTHVRFMCSHSLIWSRIWSRPGSWPLVVYLWFFLMNYLYNNRYLVHVFLSTCLWEWSVKQLWGHSSLSQCGAVDFYPLILLFDGPIQPIMAHLGYTGHHSDKQQGHQGILGYLRPPTYRQAATSDGRRADVYVWLSRLERLALLYSPALLQTLLIGTARLRNGGNFIYVRMAY